MLDGGNNNDDVIGQRAGTQARTAIESVQEFQVITNQFDAQFGRTTGAIINAVTKSRDRTRSAAVRFIFGQEAAWTAKDYFAKERNLRKPDTKRVECGGTLGGPIVKDKAHFFFSLERVMIDRGIDDRDSSPSRPQLSPTDPDRVWNTMAKFDHQLNANHTWGIRWLRELSPQQNQIIPPSASGRVRRHPRGRRRGPDRGRYFVIRCLAARRSTRCAPVGRRRMWRSPIPASRQLRAASARAIRR